MSHELNMQQTDFSIPDETRSMTHVRIRCPWCYSKPELWRINANGKNFFQVRCPSHKNRSGIILCKQTPVPFEPIPDASEAVRAWIVYCSMLRDQNTQLRSTDEIQKVLQNIKIQSFSRAQHMPVQSAMYLGGSYGKNNKAS